MFNFWFFVPKSGLAFILVSVINFFVWNIYRNRLSHPYLTVIFTEIILFLICFFFTDLESRKKINK